MRLFIIIFAFHITGLSLDLENLPSDLKKLILKEASIQDINSFCQSSKTQQQFCADNEDALWQFLVERDLGFTRKLESLSWKNFYKKISKVIVDRKILTGNIVTYSNGGEYYRDHSISDFNFRPDGTLQQFLLSKFVKYNTKDNQDKTLNYVRNHIEYNPHKDIRLTSDPYANSIIKGIIIRTPSINETKERYIVEIFRGDSDGIIGLKIGKDSTIENLAMAMGISIKNMKELIKRYLVGIAMLPEKYTTF